MNIRHQSLWEAFVLPAGTFLQIFRWKFRKSCTKCIDSKSSTRNNLALRRILSPLGLADPCFQQESTFELYSTQLVIYWLDHSATRGSWGLLRISVIYTCWLVLKRSLYGWNMFTVHGSPYLIWMKNLTFILIIVVLYTHIKLGNQCAMAAVVAKNKLHSTLSCNYGARSPYLTHPILKLQYQGQIMTISRYSRCPQRHA